jgi:hypothetical protein
MATSHYFPQRYGGNKSEQNLIQDLVDEQIKLFGCDLYYLPRIIIKENSLSDIIYSKFEKQFQIEMLLQNVEGFGNEAEFVSKFGLRVTDEITFVVSKRRWELEGVKFGLAIRPLEGDLLFFPLTKQLYEIKFVRNETAFYQLGEIYFYTIVAEIYEFNNDTIETGISDIDDMDSLLSNSTTLVLKIGGSGVFLLKETITGSVSGTTARVSSWNPNTRKLIVYKRDGNFVENETITGTDAIWEIESFDTLEDVNTKYSQNKYIEEEANTILDFSEKNAFGDYGNFMDSF